MIVANFTVTEGVRFFLVVGGPESETDKKPTGRIAHGSHSEKG